MTPDGPSHLDWQSLVDLESVPISDTDHSHQMKGLRDLLMDRELIDSVDN